MGSIEGVSKWLAVCMMYAEKNYRLHSYSMMTLEAV